MKLFAIVIIAFLAVGSAFALQVTDNDANDANVDIAVDSSDRVHAVYERNGNIYYNGTGPEELIAAGANPAIGVGPDGEPQVVFENAGAVWYTTRSGSWSAPMKLSDGSSADIAVDGSNKAHIVYRSNLAGDGYVDVVYASSADGFTPVLIWNGAYNYWGGGSASADYYSDYPISIAADAQGNYAILARYYHFDRAPGWTDRSYGILVYSSAAENTFSGGVNGVPARNALAIGPDGVIYATWNGGKDLAVIDDAWTESATNLGSSEAAIAADGSRVALAFVVEGGVYHADLVTGGVSSPSLLGEGKSPAIALGSTYVYYVASDGHDDEIYSGGDMPPADVPEFGTIAAGLVLVAGIGLVVMRRK